MNNPLVSIIIPTYNRAHLIGETLDSVLAQTYANWECIIVDDGSTDNTQEVVGDYIERDARFLFFNRDFSKPKGASSCRNTGLNISRGDYCLFLDSDDWLIENCLEQRVNFLKINPNFDFMVVTMQTKKQNEEAIDQTIPISKDYLLDFLGYKLHWGIMCTLWKKELLIKIKGFNENYPRLNDPELHIRAMLASKDNFYVGREFPADSIYRMDEVKSGNVFSQKYLNSLMLFFPDIVKALKENNRIQDKNNLKKYLVDYLINFSKSVPIMKNFKLIYTSKTSTVINSKELTLLLIWCFFKSLNDKIFNYVNRKLNLIINLIKNE